MPVFPQILFRGHCFCKICQKPKRKFKRLRPSKVDIFADYGEAIKDKELEKEKRLLEEMDDEEE